ncbi:unnamed protein product [Eruca vesicaria subsp. sativa]|uniref:Uncharacterized protein n=1 Tax=Eruca vesicaria subsp. sativa TaxID=29727 RepID=A0ABC8KL07_ERUVS|nr:unnamed protein product [Eruca vesicaria subsp. sativa]
MRRTSNLRPIITFDALQRTNEDHLLFIASHFGGNQTLQPEALRMAHNAIKKGENTQFFRDLVKYKMDSAWYKSVDHRAEHKKGRLENELNSTYRLNRLLVITLYCLFC